MKTLTLLLLLGMLGCAKPQPVPPTNPNVIRLRDFSKAHHLYWTIDITYGDYCACLNDPRNRFWQCRCRWSLSQAVNNAMSDWPVQEYNSWKLEGDESK